MDADSHDYDSAHTRHMVSLALFETISYPLVCRNTDTLTADGKHRQLAVSNSARLIRFIFRKLVDGLFVTILVGVWADDLLVVR